MAAAELVAGQRGAEDQQRVGLGRLLRQEGGEAAVERAQPAFGDPAVEVGEQAAHGARAARRGRRRWTPRSGLS